AAQLPTLDFPRYFLVSATLLLLCAGELLALGFAAAGIYRLVAVGGLVAILAGTMTFLLPFYEKERGSYAVIVEEMTRNGATSYASNQDFRIAVIVNYFA
ncbi:hypothetical protein, partial [Mesorhizobium sp. M2E.F.Ca.ET.209.01.1.1]